VASGSGSTYGSIIEYEPGAIPVVSVVGLDDLKCALRYILRRAATDDSSDAVLVAGWPGSAKTSLTLNVIGLETAAGTSWRYVGVACHKLILGGHDHAQAELNNIVSRIRGSNDPTVLLLDEIDGIGELRRRGSTINEMTRTSMALLQDREVLRKAVIIGVTNYPNLLDEAVRQQFDHRLYIAPPDEETARAIIRSYGLDDTLAADVARHLFRQAEQLSGFFSGRALVNGCLKVRQLLQGNAFAGRSADDIANDISMYANLSPKELFEEYESEYKEFIRAARGQERQLSEAFRIRWGV